MHYPIEGCEFWEKVVLAICHKCHQHYSCIQLAAVLFHFWWNYTTERFQTVHCADIMIRQSSHVSSASILVQQRLRSSWRIEIWWVRSLFHQLPSLEMCSLWEKLQKIMWEVQTKLTCQNIFPYFPWKVTIQWHYYHNMYYIHYLKMFCNYCHINKQCILSILNMFLTCQPQTIGRNLSYSLVFKKLNCLIPLTTKVNPAKNPTSS